LPERVVKIDAEDIWIGELFKQIGFVKSSSEFLRKVQEGAVRVEGEKLTDPTSRLTLRLTSFLLELGRKIAKVRLQDASSGLDNKGGAG